jgi:hypothetical protein
MWLQIIANEVSRCSVSLGQGEERREDHRREEEGDCLAVCLAFIIQSDFHEGFCLGCGH